MPRDVHVAKVYYRKLSGCRRRARDTPNIIILLTYTPARRRPSPAVRHGATYGWVMGVMGRRALYQYSLGQDHNNDRPGKYKLLIPFRKKRKKKKKNRRAAALANSPGCNFNILSQFISNTLYPMLLLAYRYLFNYKIVVTQIDML